MRLLSPIRIGRLTGHMQVEKLWLSDPSKSALNAPLCLSAVGMLHQFDAVAERVIDVASVVARERLVLSTGMARGPEPAHESRSRGGRHPLW